MTRALVDTNVVLRHHNRGDALHGRVSAFIDALLDREYELCVCSQVLFEAWVVMTRPQRDNGWEMSAKTAAAEVAQMIAAYSYLSDPPSLFDTWLTVCTDHDVRGKPAHDARLVAFMLGAGVRELVTLNPRR